MTLEDGSPWPKKAVPMIQDTNNKRCKRCMGLPLILKERGCFLS